MNETEIISTYKEYGYTPNEIEEIQKQWKEKLITITEKNEELLKDLILEKGLLLNTTWFIGPNFGRQDFYVMLREYDRPEIIQKIIDACDYSLDISLDKNTILTNREDGQTICIKFILDRREYDWEYFCNLLTDFIEIHSLNLVTFPLEESVKEEREHKRQNMFTPDYEDVWVRVKEILKKRSTRILEATRNREGLIIR
jgi:hypothetical protein